MKYIYLNNGVKIPQIGIGGFAQSATAISKAIELGYRLIDTAAQYGNEEQVGKAIKNSGVNREEIFITTKLWTEEIRRERVRVAFEESLKRLQVDYLDLYLIHWPAYGFEKAWIEMEKLYDKGYIRAIGVSNFHLQHLEKLIEISSIRPAVNQIESHPYFSNQKLIDSCKKKNIAIEAWCPLGGAYGNILDDKQINILAEKYQKTAAQIILRWHIQRGIIIFPKTSKEERMRQNIDVFDFELSINDIQLIDALNTGKRMGADPENFEF